MEGITLISIYAFDAGILYKVKDNKTNEEKYIMHRGLQSFSMPDGLPKVVYKNINDTNITVINELVNIHNDTIVKVIDSISDKDKNKISNEILTAAKNCVITKIDIQEG